MTVAWLALFMVLVQFVIVVMRYVFGLGSVKLQESIVYMHATVFMVARRLYPARTTATCAATSSTPPPRRAPRR